MTKQKLLLIGVMLCLTLPACGLKGPLYLPEDAKPASEQPVEPETEDEHEATA